MGKKILEIFREEGTGQILSSTNFLSFSKKGVIWAFEKNPIHLFIKGPKTRYFLGQFTAPLFFSLPGASEYSIIAASSEETRYYELSEEILESHLEKEGSLQKEFSQCLQAWIQALTEGFAIPIEKTHEWRTFAEAVQAALPGIFIQKQREDFKLLEEWQEEQEENMQVALRHLEKVLVPPSIPIVKKTEEALKQACQLLGSFLGIEFSFPQHVFLSKDIEEQLTVICEVSQIQKRKVKLEGEWWKTDHGPLLGFYGEEKKPVVLLKNERIEVDRKVRINSTVAQGFSETAFMFYVPLPEEVNSGRRLLSFFVKKYLKTILSVFFYGTLGGLVSFFFPIATKLLFTYAIPESDAPLVLYLTLGLIFTTIGFASFYFCRTLLFLRLEGLSSNLIQPALWDRVLKLPLSFFHRYSAGNLFWRLASVEEIRQLLTGNGSSILLSGIFSFFYLFIMAIYSPLLSFIALGFSLLGILLTIVCSSLKINILHNFLEVQGKIKGFMIQMILGVGKLRTSGAERNAFSHWALAFGTSKSLELEAQNIQNIVATASALLPILTLWGVYATLIGFIGIHKLSLANFLAFNVGLGSFLSAIYPLNTMAIQLCNIFPLWKRTQIILEVPPEIRKGKSPPGKLSGRILVDSVVFQYPDSSVILNNITLEVRAHEFIAIVGPSGCGKSTLLRLLLGLEKPCSGGIYYDEKDLASLDLWAVRRQIGSVLQTDQLISGSLYENLTHGKAFTSEQVLQAIHLAGLEKDFEQLPMGLHTYVPMNGSTFSGGQKQRIFLARALLQQPSLLIFDEATSALDNRTQEEIMQNIAALNLTRIIVAQRLNTVKRADRIYVIEKGVILQAGAFEELANSPGLFSEMLIRQRL